MEMFSCIANETQVAITSQYLGVTQDCIGSTAQQGRQLGVGHANSTGQHGLDQPGESQCQSTWLIRYQLNSSLHSTSLDCALNKYKNSNA